MKPSSCSELFETLSSKNYISSNVVVFSELVYLSSCLITSLIVFSSGRNRKLQGLAASIVKLWEKCEIAKVAIKRGVQNTNSELMAEEIKVCATV